MTQNKEPVIFRYVETKNKWTRLNTVEQNKKLTEDIMKRIENREKL